MTTPPLDSGSGSDSSDAAGSAGSVDSAGSVGRGRRIETPTEFTGDDGRADPRWEAAFSADDGEAVGQILRDGVRLLVPIVAVLDEVDESGGDKSSHMASVSLVQPDGRRGLLAFTSLAAMSRWDPSARPVPAWAADVAAAAIAEGAHGVLVDVAGPVAFAIDGELLSELGR